MPRPRGGTEPAAGLKSLAIARRSTADQVADALREHIVRGELRPGMPLREAALASTFGVARNTVREGIRILIGEGLLRHNIHRGVVVSVPTAEDVRDIYRTRRLIEMAAVLQGDHASTGALDAMEDAVRDLNAAVDAEDWQRIVSADFSFHTQLVEPLRMRRLQAFHAGALLELRLALALLDSSVGDAHTWASQHEEICRLLRASQPQGCARVVEQHLIQSEDRLVKVVESMTRSSGGGVHTQSADHD